MKATIFEIKRFAVHDGDGIRTTVFFKGCPLKCLWCHNPEGLSSRPQEAFYENKCIGCGQCKKEGFRTSDCPGEARVTYGEEISAEALLPLLTEDRDFYENSGGGVTLSGGECLMQADFCAELLQRLKAEGIHTAVDTCGFVPQSALQKVMPWTDIFLYDLKAFDTDVHEKCTGVPNGQILENLKFLTRSGKAVEIRIPYVPGYNDDQVEKIGHFLASLENITKLRLLAYHNYAGSKYRALALENTLPSTTPTPEALAEAGAKLAAITGLPVMN